MAKTEITTPDGLKIRVVGTPDEVAKILEHARRGNRPARASKATRQHRGGGKEGLPSLLDALRDEKFFKQKRPLGEIAGRLAEMGNHYSGTTLGKQLLREVRSRRLRRLKQEGNWVYVQ